MRMALSLARKGLGATSPNPMVGAVLVKGGKIVGKGYHKKAGGHTLKSPRSLTRKKRRRVQYSM